MIDVLSLEYLKKVGLWPIKEKLFGGYGTPGGAEKNPYINYMRDKGTAQGYIKKGSRVIRIGSRVPETKNISDIVPETKNISDIEETYNLEPKESKKVKFSKRPVINFYCGYQGSAPQIQYQPTPVSQISQRFQTPSQRTESKKYPNVTPAQIVRDIRIPEKEESEEEQTEKQKRIKKIKRIKVPENVRQMLDELNSRSAALAEATRIAAEKKRLGIKEEIPIIETPDVELDINAPPPPLEGTGMRRRRVKRRRRRRY